MGKGNIFRKLLAEKEYVIMPGAYDCLSAQIIESMGFDAIDVTGFGIEASRFGQPDLGLAGMSEVVDQCGNIAGSVDLPVIADADNGYGGLLNVTRTVKLLKKAGLAGMHMEDQAAPKKCGHLAGKMLISMEEMCAKIRAAKYEAGDDFLVIGRSDSRSLGLDEVKRRLHAYLDAGADLVMPGDDYPVGELREISSEFRGKLFLVIGIYPGEEMCLSASDYAAMGAKCISYPIIGLNAAAHAIKNICSVLKETGRLTEEQLAFNTLHIDEMEDIVHMDRWQSVEDRFGNWE